MRTESQLHIAPDHPAFAGHFPASPIVPGVVLLDAVVHAAQQLLQQAGPCEIGSAKFLSPMRPGETVTIGLERSGPQQLRFDLAVDGRRVATGTVVMPCTP